MGRIIALFAPILEESGCLLLITKSSYRLDDKIRNNEHC